MKSDDEEKVLRLLNEISENLAKNASADKSILSLKSAIIALSAPKTHGLRFETLLHDLLQKINIEIGLNGLRLDDDSQNKWTELQTISFEGLGSWAKSSTLAQMFGSKQ